MATLPQQAAPAPAAPATPRPATVAQSAADLRTELRELAAELKQNVRERVDLQRQLERATGAEAARIRAEIAAVDAKNVALEARISEQASKMAEAQFSTIAQTVIPPMPPRAFGPSQAAINDVFRMGSLAIIVLLTIAIARRLWRRPQQAPPPPPHGATIPPARLDRLEHAMDAMAIEIERIAENQRFVTKLLTERGAEAPPVPRA